MKNNSGQGALEYIIICSLVGVFCLLAIKTFGKRLETRIDWMNKKIETHIKNK